MENFVLSCCSTADLSLEHFQNRNIHYICFHYELNGTVYPDDLGQSMPFDVFYEAMTKGAETKTFQVNVAEFEAYFETFLQEGKDILHLCLSSGITGVLNSANIARDILLEKYPELHIVHFDAHADLRDDYLGAQLSHACVLRRCHDLLGDGRIHQFCIRSGDREEFQFAARHTDIHKFDFTGLQELTDWLCQANVPVYLTIDLDCLDPSAFPGTGTPEAGGVSFLQLLGAIRTVTKANIIGADVNELAPMLDQSGVSTATACKVLRELLLALD